MVTSILLIVADAAWKIVSANDYALLKDGWHLLESGISAGSSLLH